VVEKHLRAPKRESQTVIRRALSSFLNTHRLSGGNPAVLLVPLFDMLGIKRFETMQHSQRVSAYARLIGARHGLDARSLQELEIGALLHDIGKAAIPHNVLMKPDSLNDEEWRVMKTHALIGAELLVSIPGIAAEAEIVYCHHERFDGSGYPRGLKLGEIPLGARIFAVADTLDAICSDRPYRMAKPFLNARREIDRVAGTHFDPRVVESFHRVTDLEIEAIQKQFPDVYETSDLEQPAAEISFPDTKIVSIR
jgi:HD-GYP domain-containing protein (c-di-GMP phosphodiesterase class II)